jgi:hypothetical protein
MILCPDLPPVLTHCQATSGSRPEVVETPQAMSSTPAEEPAVMDTGDILIPGPVSTLMNSNESIN